MIPAGHAAIDRWAIATLHGLTPTQARRRRPWTASGHPAPLNPRRGAGGGRYPLIWDQQQAAAHAAGTPSPPLPTGPDPNDLLDSGDAGELAGIEAGTWRTYVRDGYAPPPDAQPCGVPHWRRATVDRTRATAPGRGRGGGGRRPNPATGRTAEHERVRAVLAAAGDGPAPTTTGLAAAARVNRVTALKYRRLERQATDTATTDPDEQQATG